MGRSMFTYFVYSQIDGKELTADFFDKRRNAIRYYKKIKNRDGVMHSNFVLFTKVLRYHMAYYMKEIEKENGKPEE